MSSPSLDLTNINQQEFLTRKRGGKPPVNPAKLTAVSWVGLFPRVGNVWLCRCDCGGEREVPAMYFTSGRIKKCTSCVDPQFAGEPTKLLQRREQIALEGGRWYPEPFASSWLDTLAGFGIERRLLFEVVLGNRRRTPEFMKQATDIVNRVPEAELDIEFGQYSRKRIAEARERLTRQIESLRS